MISDRAQSILTQLQADRSEVFHLLERLVECESPSRHPPLQQRVQEVLIDELDELGFRVRRIPGEKTGGYLLGIPRWREKGRPVQILVGHCDTVWPEGTLEEMPITRRGDKMTGPGIYDMKGGLAQIVFALRGLRALELEPEVTPLIFVNSDEEIGSDESRSLVARVSKIADRVLVLEPAFGPRGKLKTARKGVGQFEIRVHGRAAHAGLEPAKGVSAILELSLVVQQLFALNDPDNGLSVNVGTIDGGLRTNVVAPESRATVDVRVVSLSQAREVEAAFHALEPQHPDAELEVSGGFMLPPMEPTPGNQALWRLAQEAAAEMDLEVEDCLAGGGSDGNIASQFAPTLDGLGPRGDGAHAIHEHVLLDSLVERGTLLALLLLAPPLNWNGQG
jgi:glutamate carboxypeptidase